MRILLIIGAILLILVPPSICHYFSLTSQLQVDFISALIIEVLGSFLLAIFVGLLFNRVDQMRQRNNDKKDAEYWLSERLPKILENNFKRSSGYNYNVPNLKAFFDGSHINSTYDRFEDFRQKIYQYRDLVEDKSLISQLESFAEKVEEAYREAEELANLVKRDSDGFAQRNEGFWSRNPNAAENCYYASVLGVSFEDYDPRLVNEFNVGHISGPINNRIRSFRNNNQNLIGKIQNYRKSLQSICVDIEKKVSS